MISIAAQVMNQKTACLELVTSATQEGQDFFHLIAIRKDKIEAFRKRLASESVDLNREGVILESGWGKVSEEQVAHWRVQYQLN